MSTRLHRKAWGPALALALCGLLAMAASSAAAPDPATTSAAPAAEESGAVNPALAAEAAAAALAQAEAAAGDAAAEFGLWPDGTDASSPSAEAAAKLQQLRRNEFFYQSYGKADPFKTLVQGRYEQLAGSELVDLNSARLVGVMWGADDQFALVEDGNGFGYILRVGDPVLNGTVVSIRKNSLTAKITLYGMTSTVSLKLDRTEG